MMISSAGSGSGSCSHYVNPHIVMQLVIRRRPRELLAYMDIPGTALDLFCHQVRLIAGTLLDIMSQPERLSLHEEDRQILCLAEDAWFHAANSRFSALQMVGNPSNFTSYAGHYTHPHNSSSYYGRMLTHEPDSNELRHVAVHNQLSASNSRIHGARFPPLRASSSDVISFTTRRARMLDETSAFNSGTHASAYVPLQGPYMHPHNSSTNSRRMLSSEPDSNELIHSAASSSTPAPTFLWPKDIFYDVRPTVDIKEKKPASEVKQIKAKILRLNVASGITKDGYKTAGVLIRDGSTEAKFMTASCFRLHVDPASDFATACYEGIRTALSYGPTTIVLESHQVPLLEHLVATRSRDAVQLDQLVGSNPPYFIIQTIPEESNGAACKLVRHASQMEKWKMVFSCNDPPEWLLRCFTSVRSVTLSLETIHRQKKKQKASNKGCMV